MPKNPFQKTSVPALDNAGQGGEDGFSDNQPNEKTLVALKESEAVEQLERVNSIDELFKDNPDLPADFVRAVIQGKDEIENDDVEPYIFGSSPNSGREEHE